MNTLEYMPAALLTWQDSILFLDDSLRLQNQDWSVVDQWNAGVRFMEYDVHYIKEWTETMRACHGGDAAAALEDLCPLLEAGGSGTCLEIAGIPSDVAQWNLGCYETSPTWNASIYELSQLLINSIDNHPNEVLILRLQDETRFGTGAGADSLPDADLFLDPLETYLAPYILSDAELSAWRAANPGQDWPSFLQLTEDIGKHVIIEDSLFKAEYGSGHMLDYFVSLDTNLVYPANLANEFVSATCNSLSPDFTYFIEDSLVIKFEGLGFDIDYDGQANGILDGDNAPSFLECGFSPCYDNIVEDDLMGMVWSWKEGYASVSCEEDVCPSYTSLGWTQSHLCSASLKSACQSDTDPQDWTLSVAASTFDAAVECPTGYSFQAPQSAMQNSNLGVAAGSEDVWINVDYYYDADDAIFSEGCGVVVEDDNSAAHILLPSLGTLFLCTLLL